MNLSNTLATSASMAELGEITGDQRFIDMKALDAEIYNSMREISVAKATVRRDLRLRSRLHRELSAEMSEPQVVSLVQGDVERRVSLWLAAGIAACLALSAWVYLGRPADPGDAPVAQKVISAVSTPALAAEPVQAAKATKPAADRYRAFTAGTPLADCVGVTEHPRWELAVAIARQETGLGTNIKSALNNVGNIRSHKAGRTWKQYPDKCQALEDVAVLLETDNYRNLKAVDQVRARYCGGDAEGCQTWTPNVTKFLAELES